MNNTLVSEVQKADQVVAIARKAYYANRTPETLQTLKNALRNANSARSHRDARWSTAEEYRN